MQTHSSGRSQYQQMQMIRLTRTEFAHILGAFPLIFPEDAAGRAKRAALLAVFDGVEHGLGG